MSESAGVPDSAVRSLIDTVMSHLHDTTGAIAGIKENMVIMRSEVEKIRKTLFDYDGRPSLMSRVEKAHDDIDRIEEAAKALHQDVDKMELAHSEITRALDRVERTEKAVEIIQKTQEAQETERGRNRIQLAVALIGAFTAIIVAAIALLAH